MVQLNYLYLDFYKYYFPSPDTIFSDFKPGWSLFHSLGPVSGYTSSDSGLIYSLVGRIPDNIRYQSVGGRSKQTAD